MFGRPRAPSSPTAREMPRGVAVASIARLPSSTDDPSGSTADRHEPVEDWGSTRGHVHRFQSIVNSKGGKRYPRPSRLQPSRDSTPLLRTRHRCRTNPKTRQRTQNREGGWGSKTGRVGCGCHEDRRPRRRWTDANSLSDSHSRLSYWLYRKSAVCEPRLADGERDATRGRGGVHRQAP